MSGLAVSRSRYGRLEALDRAIYSLSSQHGGIKRIKQKSATRAPFPVCDSSDPGASPRDFDTCENSSGENFWLKYACVVADELDLSKRAGLVAHRRAVST